jgi:NTE family protein
MSIATWRLAAGRGDGGSPNTAGRWHRTSRRAPGTPTAFVLSGGGNQGVAQVGMLRALLELDIRPDVIVGTSAGALNGAALAHDPSPDGVEHLASVWRNLRGEDIFPGGRLARAWHAMSSGHHLCANTGIGSLIDRCVPGLHFVDLRVPLRVIATDYCTGEEVVFGAGPLRDALLASTALPGVFPPVSHGGRLLIDGGVVDNVPISHALATPAKRIFVLNVSGSEGVRPTRSPLDALLRSFAIARNHRFDRELAAMPPGVEVIVLPRPNDDRPLFDFTRSDELMDAAYQLARQHLTGATPSRPRRFRRLRAA